MRRTSTLLLTAAALVVLLAVLGTLQYRWLGDVSDAERERLRASMASRANACAEEFDRGLTALYLAVQFDPDLFDAEPGQALAQALDRARALPLSAAVRDVYLIDRQGRGAPSLRRFDPATHSLSVVEWPAPLEALRARSVAAGEAPPAPLVPDALDPSLPALMIPVPHVRALERGLVSIVPEPDGSARAVLVWLDRERIRSEILPALVARHFGAPSESDAVVTVVNRDGGSAIYANGDAAPMHAEDADVSTGFFDLRLDDVGRLAGHDVAVAGPEAGAHLAITIVRHAAGGSAARVLMAGGVNQGGWQLLARGRTGRLEAVVTRSRRRNLLVVAGVLGLLAVSFGLIVVSAERQRRLARQQLEFVAAVSHELRTPLAVIRSAGENLSDGVVADLDQVRRYGTVIRDEGRRLSDMVERVLQFAGLAAGNTTNGTARVDVEGLVADAVASVAPEAQSRRIRIDVSTVVDPVIVSGDRDALRSALNNVIANAVKYSHDEGRVAVKVERNHGAVQIVVTDQGIGIDRDDLPHVFEPFYRGRRAMEGQVPGSGVGLGIVRRVMDAHRGDVRIESRPDDGTTVTVTLPMVVEPVAEATR